MPPRVAIATDAGGNAPANETRRVRGAAAPPLFLNDSVTRTRCGTATDASFDSGTAMA
jgi:hypothetical protein